MHGGVLSQLFHLSQQGLLCGVGGQVDAAALNAALRAVVDLAAHIDLAGGVLAHQNDRQAGADTLVLECGDLFGGFCLGGSGQCLSVNNTCSHDRSLVQMYFLSLRAKRCRVLHQQYLSPYCGAGVIPFGRILQTLLIFRIFLV